MKYKFEFWEGLDGKDKVWFVWYNENMLCEMDKKSHNIRILAKLEKNGFVEGGGYKCVKKIGNRIVVLPYNASDIVIYELESQKIYHIMLDKDTDLKQETFLECRFWTSFAYGEYVYCLGFKNAEIVKLNVNTLEFEYMYYVQQEIMDYISKSKAEKLGFFYNVELVDDVAWIISLSAGAVFKLDLHNDKLEIIELCEGIERLDAIMNKGSKFYGIGMQNSNVSWLEWDEKGLLQKVHMYKKGGVKDVVYIQNVLDVGNRVFIFLFDEPYAYEMGQKSEGYKESRKIVGFLKEHGGKKFLMRGIMRIGSKICYLSEDGCWNEYDCERGLWSSYKIKLIDRKGLLEQRYAFLSQAKCQKEMSNKGFVVEQEVGLLEYLKYVKFGVVHDITG